MIPKSQLMSVRVTFESVCSFFMAVSKGQFGRKGTKKDTGYVTPTKSLQVRHASPLCLGQRPPAKIPPLCLISQLFNIKNKRQRIRC